MHINITTYLGKGIIVALDRRFVVYPGVAGVEEGAGVEDLFYTRPLLHRQPYFVYPRGAGVEEGAGVEDLLYKPL